MTITTSKPDLLVAMEDLGYRLTASRRRVVDLLSRREATFSSEEVCAELPGVGRATVYRTMKLLLDAGVLCKTSLLHGGGGSGDLPAATITANVSGKYEDRWVRLRRASDNCAFLKRAAVYELPVAHGEGRVMASSGQKMNRLAELGCVAMQYTSHNGASAAYPDNPNGSMMDVAGLCDPSGRIFGLMPHPERFIHETQHPEWTSRDDTQADGRAIFESAVAHFV